jgi:adenylate kinase family enzyme
MYVIHVSGFSGCGKTSLGEELTEKFGQDHPQLTIIELDDFLTGKDDERHTLKQSLQQRLAQLGRDAVVLLLGTACMQPVEGKYPDIEADERIWFDVSLEDATRNAVRRQFKWLHMNAEKAVQWQSEWTSQETADWLSTYCNYHTRLAYWAPLKPICTALGYVPLSREDIVTYVQTILWARHLGVRLGA